MARDTNQKGNEAPFGARLRRLREAAGLTQEELASKAGLTAKGISALERGERKRPYPHTVRSLADALGLSEDERSALLAAVPKQRTARVVPGSAPAASGPATDSRPGLPAPPTPLVGREKELGEVKDFLARPEVRLLTLTGTGGVGKTRLATEAARGVMEWSFPDGVVFVALAPLGGPDLVLPTVTRTLGLREAEGQTSYEALCNHLRGKRLLLVLDNFEHVLEAAPEVASLVESCPNLMVMVTSRAPLRVRGEQEYPVEPLALPASTRSPAAREVTGSPSGGLFAERAKAASPVFEVTPENASSVAAICWRLAGLPLAIELAAARVRFLDPSALLDRLDKALSGGWARDVPERQRTMRATLEWSHDLLSGPERELFGRLSVFAGGFTLEAAEEVGATREDEAEDVLEILWGLAEQSLVTVEASRHPEAETRYGMLEPVRQYAREKLEESTGEAEEVRRRHAEHYHELALEAGPLLMGQDQVTWLDRTWREQHNFRAAMRFLLDRGEMDRAISLTWAFWRYWWVTGLQGEARRWMQEVLARGDLPGDDIYPARRAQANLTIGTYAWSEGDLDSALPALEEGLRLSRKTRDALAQAIGLMLLGLVDAAGRSGARARERIEESLRLYRVAGEEWGEALTLNYLGLDPFLRGEHEAAKRCFEEGLASARAAGDRIAAHQALYNLGLLALAEEDLDRAAGHFSEGLSLAAEVRDVLNAPYFIKGLGQVAGLRCRAATAVRLLGAAETALKATGSPPYRYVPDEALQDRVLAAARDELGEADFEEEWRRGRAMTAEQAVEYALNEDGEPSTPQRPATDTQPPARGATVDVGDAR